MTGLAEQARRVVAMEAMLKAAQDQLTAERKTLAQLMVPGARWDVTDDAGMDMGRTVMTKPKTYAKVTDPAALLAWVEANAEAEVLVETVERRYVNPAFEKALLAAHGVDQVTGELVPGIEDRAGRATLTVTVTADAKAKAVSLVGSSLELGAVLS